MKVYKVEPARFPCTTRLLEMYQAWLFCQPMAEWQFMQLFCRIPWTEENPITGVVVAGGGLGVGMNPMGVTLGVALGAGSKVMMTVVVGVVVGVGVPGVKIT